MSRVWSFILALIRTVLGSICLLLSFPPLFSSLTPIFVPFFFLIPSFLLCFPHLLPPYSLPPIQVERPLLPPNQEVAQQLPKSQHGQKKMKWLVRFRHTSGDTGQPNSYNNFLITFIYCFTNWNFDYIRQSQTILYLTCSFQSLFNTQASK